MAGTGVIAAPFSRGVAAGAGFGAEILAILRHLVAGGDITFTIRAGTGGFGFRSHSANI